MNKKDLRTSAAAMIAAGALIALAGCSAREAAQQSAPSSQSQAVQPSKAAAAPKVVVNKLSFHYDAQRTGWNDEEEILTPETVAKSDFGLLWSSPQFDSVGNQEPRLFASPLYVNDVTITAGDHKGVSGPVVFAASHHGYVYAVSAFKSDAVSPGDILWRKRLIDHGCGGKWGLLSTPVIDAGRGHIYVSACDSERRFEVHALTLGGGEEAPGWPVSINRESVNAPGVSKNGTTLFPEGGHFLQRGALNLSPDGSRLYVPFGGDGSSGWMVAIDTNARTVTTAFSTTSRTEEAQGGMWASGGPSLDKEGRIHIATGASFYVKEGGGGIEGIFPDSANNWGQSIIQLAHMADGFKLSGTYTPFNYCPAQFNDIDLGSSGTISIDLDPSTTSTPRLLALLGAKQGNAYLLDRDNMPGSLTQRPSCSDDPSTDGSLHAPEDQPQFGEPGPINIFQPYSNVYGWFDLAKSRTTGAYFRAADGAHYLFASGSAKEKEDSGVSIPPGLVRLKIVTEPKKPAFLRIDKAVMNTIFMNPGSPIVTSHKGENAIVWVIDLNAPRTMDLWGETTPKPILYAFDALSLDLLWRSEEGDLETTGKYNEPAIINGVVYVGTDRIQAFGPGATEPPPAEETFLSLFDGKTLDGWHGDERFWSVRDGVLVGKSDEPIDANTFLIHEKTFGNFELRLKYRFLTEQGNSGLQYRSRPNPDHEFGMIGYQANVVTPDANERFAMLWDEDARGGLGFLGEHVNVLRGDSQRHVYSSPEGAFDFAKIVRPYPGWNELTVIAYENRLVHAVNGRLAVDVTDNDLAGRAMEGVFGLQLHDGPPMGIEFKDIEVKELNEQPSLWNRFQDLPLFLDAQEDDSERLSHGQEIYNARCALCHSADMAGVPPLETIASFSEDRITQSLRDGLMQVQAAGLSDADIEAVAGFLTQTPIEEIAEHENQ